MMRKCLRCNTIMREDGYMEDQGVQISDFVIVEKGEDLKKTKHPIKIAICPECGYLEFYLEKKVEEKPRNKDYLKNIKYDSFLLKDEDKEDEEKAETDEE